MLTISHQKEHAKSYTHLTLEDRIDTSLFVSMSLSCRKMAMHLGRSHTTISRELRRNGLVSDYRLQSEQRLALRKRQMPRHYRCLTRPEIVADRTRFGDWEADLIFASQGKAALLSCNKGKCRFLLLSEVEDKTAASFDCALIDRLLDIPSVFSLALT